LWSFMAGGATITAIVIFSLVDSVNLINIVIPISIFAMIALLSQIQRHVSKKFEWNYQV